MGERFKSKFFLSHSNFWFVPYRDRDNFPKNDDLFPIGVFPIGTEDCNRLKLVRPSKSQSRLKRKIEISRLIQCQIKSRNKRTRELFKMFSHTEL